MTIRSRLTAWYTSVLLASILLMAGVMYYELVYERRANAAAGLRRESMEEELVEVIFFYGVPSALATVLGGSWLLRKALTPLDQLTRAAERIQADNLREPLPRSGNGDEIDRLSDVLNATVARLDDSFQSIREFTLHASHELKTPLTVIRSELETGLNDEPLSARQRDRIVSLLDEIERLTHIVDSLTLLTRADAGQLKPTMACLALDELVREAMEDAQALAQPQQIAVQLDQCHAVEVLGDRRRLRQLLLILADNAIKYNFPMGRVCFALTVERDLARIDVANTGPGIAPHLTERVFDRFFRGDSSHERNVDGCGLGLTIARWIVQSHGGTIQIASHPQQLTTVTVRFPTGGPRPRGRGEVPSGLNLGLPQTHK